MDRNAWFTAVAGFALATAAHAAPFALVTDLSGGASVMEGAKQSKVSLLSYIESPSELKVEAAGKVGITYFANGVQYSFEGPARVALDAKEPRVVEGKPAQPTKVGPEKGISGGLSNDQWRRLQQATVVMRTVKPNFTVVSPGDKSMVLARQPEFEWTPAADAKRYRVVVYGPDNQVLHEATTDKTSLQAAALNLAPGVQYRWKVDALGVSKPASTGALFTVADDSARDRMTAIRPDPAAPLPAQILYATNLEAEGFLADARAAWKALAVKHPDIPEIKQRTN